MAVLKGKKGETAGQTPQQDLRGTKEVKRDSEAADRGYKTGIPGIKAELARRNKLATLNNLKNQRLPDLRTAAHQLENEVKKKVAIALITSPVFWIIVFIVMIILFIIYLILGGSEDMTDKNPLIITKIGPSQAKNGDILNYSINVQYPGSAQSAVITDPLPDGTQFVSAVPKATETGGVVTWDANTLSSLLSDPINMTVTLKLKATRNNNSIGNIATVTLTGASFASGSGTTTQGNLPASNDNCHGIYSSWMSQVQSVLPRLHISGANYGDPTCQLVEKDPNGNWIINKDKELAFLKDPNGGNLSDKEAQAVFICIIPNESSYNADAFNPNSTSAGSSGTPGAFGLFQMNAKGFANTGQPEDVGDVVWSLQITNAIAWKNKYNGGKWSNYWPQSYSGCLAQYGQ